MKPGPGEWRDALLDAFDRLTMTLTGLAVASSVASLVLLWRSGPSSAVTIYLILSINALAIIAVLLNYLLVATARQRLHERLGAIRDAAHELGGGDLSVEMPEGDDDLGAMGASLNTMRERVGRLLKAQRDLLSGVSHELRSPLARIEVGLELIDMQLTEQSDHDLIVGIREEVALLERHIARLLETQRVTKDRVILSRRPVNVDALLTEVVAREEARLKLGGWRVELALNAPEIEVLADLNALDRVFSTLVENIMRHASKPPSASTSGALDDLATDGGPEQTEDDAPGLDGDVPWRPSLRLETQVSDQGLIVRFLDRGPGLDEDQCVQVFEPFFRGDRSRSSATGGTGLGMYLTRNILRAHHGDVLATPRPGGGLCVELRLPMRGQGDAQQTMRVQWTDAREEP